MEPFGGTRRRSRKTRYRAASRAPARTRAARQSAFQMWQRVEAGERAGAAHQDLRVRTRPRPFRAGHRCGRGPAGHRHVPRLVILGRSGAAVARDMAARQARMIGRCLMGGRLPGGGRDARRYSPPGELLFALSSTSLSQPLPTRRCSRHWKRAAPRVFPPSTNAHPSKWSRASSKARGARTERTSSTAAALPSRESDRTACALRGRGAQ